MGHHEYNVFQGIGPSPRTVRSRTHLIGDPDKRLDGPGVRGINNLSLRQPVDGQRIRNGHPDGLHIGSVTAGRTNESVLTVGCNG